MNYIKPSGVEKHRDGLESVMFAQTFIPKENQLWKISGYNKRTWTFIVTQYSEGVHVLRNNTSGTYSVITDHFVGLQLRESEVYDFLFVQYFTFNASDLSQFQPTGTRVKTQGSVVNTGVVTELYPRLFFEGHFINDECYFSNDEYDVIVIEQGPHSLVVVKYNSEERYDEDHYVGLVINSDEAELFAVLHYGVKK